MVTCAKLGMDFVACTSAKYFPEQKLVDYSKKGCSRDWGNHYID